MGNTFGQLFRVTTFGESHGGGIGVVVDGCPPRIAVSDAEIQQELDRRRPGQSKITTQREEPDRCEILSGVFEGRTLGTPITVLVRNQDARPEAYEAMRETFRPSHADFTYQAKYGIRSWQGGGRASARETIGRVAAAAIAREQDSVTSSGKRTKLAARGRHDPCVLPRAVPMVEAMTALVLCDHALRQKAIAKSQRASM